MTSELIQNLLTEESSCRVVFLKLREDRDHLEVECNKALHTLQMVKRKLYKEGFTGNIMRDEDGNRLMKLPKSDTAENTRAVPDVPELVRYECELIGDFIDSYGMVEHSDGDYVLHNQVLALISGRDEIISRLSAVSDRFLSQMESAERRAEVAEAERDATRDDRFDGLWRFWNRKARELSQRNVALEAKLAQIKAQEPVAWVDVTDMKLFTDWTPKFSPIVLTKSKTDDDDVPLYSAPVDQSAEIERLREALREVHTMIEHDRTGRFKMVQNVINAALSEKDPS